MIFADSFGRRWGSEILQPVLVEEDVKSLTVRSLVSAVPWGTQNELVVMNISAMTFVAPNLACGEARGGSIPAVGL